MYPPRIWISSVMSLGASSVCPRDVTVEQKNNTSIDRKVSKDTRVMLLKNREKTRNGAS